jgi:ribosomal protein S12 methylthiotransferase accessory factor
MEKRYINPEELHEFANVLPRITKSWVVRFLSWNLQRISDLLGFPVYIALPNEVIELRKYPDSLQALRIVKRLQQAGYIAESGYQVFGYPDEPPAYLVFHTLPGEQGNGWSGKAAHTSSLAYIQWPALGEAVERYSLLHPHYRSNELVHSSYANLTKPKADIFSISSFTAAERKSGNALVRLTYDKDTNFCWAPVIDALTDKTVYAPWQWFSFAQVRKVIGSHRHTEKQEALLCPPITTGAAAGQTVSEAVLVGLLEVIERDAFIIYWLQQLPARRIDFSSIDDEEVQALYKLAKDYHIELHLLYLQTDAPVHTVCLVMIDRTQAGPAVMIDAKTGFNVPAMVVDLLQDQLAQRGARRDKKAGSTNKTHTVPINQFDQAARSKHWNKPDRLVEIEPFISGPLCSISELPVFESIVSTENKLSHLYEWCKQKKYPVYYREVISPELKACAEGISVVMVRVPNLQPLQIDEAFKATGGSRLQEIPLSLGYTPHYGPDSGYCPIPSPFL